MKFDCLDNVAEKKEEEEKENDSLASSKVSNSMLVLTPSSHVTLQYYQYM